MKKFLIFQICLFFAIAAYANEKNNLKKVFSSLEFIDIWKAENRKGKIRKLKNEDILASYNGHVDYPRDSGYHVGESKTFARILLTEHGFHLPAGSTYATHDIELAQPGFILQRSVPTPHTMIVLETNDEEIKVLHSNWAAYHCLTLQTFSKEWLRENGFKVFKTGIDEVKNSVEEPREQIVTGDVRGTWRVVVTGEIPYHRISQGTIISHSGPGGIITVNETRTVSNTFNCNVGVTVKVVSASVGFSVTSSFSRSLSYRRDVTPGKYGYVDLYYKYMVKNFDVYYDPFIGSEYLAGRGKAYKWQAVEFQYRESSN